MWQNKKQEKHQQKFKKKFNENKCQKRKQYFKYKELKCSDIRDKCSPIFSGKWVTEVLDLLYQKALDGANIHHIVSNQIDSLWSHFIVGLETILRFSAISLGTSVERFIVRDFFPNVLISHRKHWGTFPAQIRQPGQAQTTESKLTAQNLTLS